MARKYRRALVVGKFAPFHKGHQLVVDHALSIADKVIILVWSNPEFPDMPVDVRADWIRRLYPKRVFVGTPSMQKRPRRQDPEMDADLDPPPDDAPQRDQLRFTYRMLQYAKASLWWDDQIDVVVSSEPYGEDIAAYLGTIGASGRKPLWKVDAVTLDRAGLPVSGTLVREDIHARRKWLDPEVYAHFVEPVVFMGAESTGKSTIAQRMAEEVGTSLVPEYGRTYYEEHGGAMTLQGYVDIAVRHLELEEHAKRHPAVNRWTFVDTNPLTTLMFSYLYERDALPALWDLAERSVGRYRHWFVCDDDIPFEQDGWRDCELARSRVQGLILQDLDRRRITYTVLKGSLDERVATVKEVIGA